MQHCRRALPQRRLAQSSQIAEQGDFASQPKPKLLYSLLIINTYFPEKQKPHTARKASASGGGFAAFCPALVLAAFIDTRVNRSVTYLRDGVRLIIGPAQSAKSKGRLIWAAVPCSRKTPKRSTAVTLRRAIGRGPAGGSTSCRTRFASWETLWTYCGASQPGSRECFDWSC